MREFVHFVIAVQFVVVRSVKVDTRNRAGHVSTFVAVLRLVRSNKARPDFSLDPVDEAAGSNAEASLEFGVFVANVCVSN